MPPGLPKIVRDNLAKARSAAIAAVEVYNRPGGRFRTAHYIILMIIAWTSLFHAIFFRRGVRPWYRKRGMKKAVRYEYVDGDHKHWDLSECLKQYFQDQNPSERANLQFLLGLRNKIEHRHLPELDPVLYGECQGALMNFEEMLVAEFGSGFALTDSLAVSLQFSCAMPDERAAAIRGLASSKARGVLEYIEKFRGGLPADILSSTKYSFSVFLIPKIANRQSAADIAVEFVPYDSTKSEEMEQLKKVVALLREKQVPVANMDLMKPGEVKEQVKKHIPFEFNINTHTCAWKYYKIRPDGRSKDPEKTKSDYCIYDRVHKDYLYTQAWVEFLVMKLSDSRTYKEVTGQKQPSSHPRGTSV